MTAKNIYDQEKCYERGHAGNSSVWVEPCWVLQGSCILRRNSTSYFFMGLTVFQKIWNFSLMTSNPNFDLKAYFPELGKTVRSFGLNVVISEKEKNKDPPFVLHS